MPPKSKADRMRDGTLKVKLPRKQPTTPSGKSGKPAAKGSKSSGLSSGLSKSPSGNSSGSAKRKRPTLKDAGPSHAGCDIGGWKGVDMKAAWTSLKTPGNSLSKTQLAQLYNIPRTTFMDRCNLLQRRLDQGLEIRDEHFGHMSGGRDKARLFSPHEESVFVDYISEFAENGFPLTPMEVRNFACDYAQGLGKDVNFEADLLSKNWFYRFMRRHEDLTTKTPKEMSIFRATAATPQKIDAFFARLNYLMKEHKITSPDQLWNVDETGLCNMVKTTKTVGKKSSKHPYCTSGEHGENTTALTFVSASGLKCRPMVVMKGKNVMNRWTEFKPDDVLLRVSDKGYITKELFAQYSTVFIQFLNDMGLLNKKHLLILDLHVTHEKNFPFLLHMKQNGVEVLSLPPHTSQFLQPLDQTPFSVLKSKWQKALRVWNRNHCARKLSKAQFFILFPNVWKKSLSPENIQAGWMMAGLWPVNKMRIDPDVYKPKANLCKNVHHS